MEVCEFDGFRGIGEGRWYTEAHSPLACLSVTLWTVVLQLSVRERWGGIGVGEGRNSGRLAVKKHSYQSGQFRVA